MLSKTDSAVMNTVYKLCGKKKSVLLTPEEILKSTNKKGLCLFDVERSVKDLSIDGYFELIDSKRCSEKVYCITLLKKGVGYGRSVKEFRRNIYFRVILTIVLAVFSFIIGVILKAIF